MEIADRPRRERGQRAFGNSLPQTLHTTTGSDSPFPLLAAISFTLLCYDFSFMLLSSWGVWSLRARGSRSPPHHLNSCSPSPDAQLPLTSMELPGHEQGERAAREKPPQVQREAPASNAGLIWNPCNSQELRVGPSKKRKMDFISSPACASGNLIMPKCLVNRQDLLTWLGG